MIESGGLPKYKQLKRIMLEAIESGAFASGDKFYTEQECARRFNISRNTVRQALAELEAEGYITRRRGCGTMVHYPPLRNGPGDIREIGILVPCITVTLYPDVVRGIQDICTRRDTHTVLLNYDADPELERNSLFRLMEKGVSGVVSCPSYNSPPDVYEALLKSGMKLVLVDSPVSGVDCDIVGTENFQAARDGARMMVEAGCRNIVFVSGYRSANTTRERMAGFRMGLEEFGLSLEAERVFQGDFNEEFGIAAGGEVLRRYPGVDGIFVANDPIASGVVRAVLESGRSIPSDVVVCSFDEPRLPPALAVPLIELRQRRRDIGRGAAELLLSRIEEGAESRPASQCIRLGAEVFAAPEIGSRRSAGLNSGQPVGLKS